MITGWSVANTNQSAPLFHLVYGEEQVAAPGHRELLPVLWELGILPNVHVLPGVPLVPGGTLGAQMPQTPEDAIHNPSAYASFAAHVARGRDERFGDGRQTE